MKGSLEVLAIWGQVCGLVWRMEILSFQVISKGEMVFKGLRGSFHGWDRSYVRYLGWADGWKRLESLAWRDGVRAVGILVFWAVMNFLKQVVEGLRFGLRFQLKKVWLGDFKVSSCWDFGQNMDGLEIVKKNGKMKCLGDFKGHLENLKFGVGFRCWINIKMLDVKCWEGF